MLGRSCDVPGHSNFTVSLAVKMQVLLLKTSRTIKPTLYAYPFDIKQSEKSSNFDAARFRPDAVD